MAAALFRAVNQLTANLPKFTNNSNARLIHTELSPKYPKAVIHADDSNRAGVYRFDCLKHGCIYIGQTSRSIEKRTKEHLR